MGRIPHRGRPDLFVYQKITREIEYATTVEVLTPIRPGNMKLWFRRYFPMRVVPVRSKLMAARSLG